MIVIHDSEKYELNRFKDIQFCKKNQFPTINYIPYKKFVYCEVMVSEILEPNIIENLISNDKFINRISNCLEWTKYFHISSTGTNWDDNHENYKFNLEGVVEIYIDFIRQEIELVNND